MTFSVSRAVASLFEVHTLETNDDMFLVSRAKATHALGAVPTYSVHAKL